MLGLPDFDYVAEKVLDFQSYAAIRHGAGSESSYRYNLEAFDKFRFRPRVMISLMHLDDKTPTELFAEIEAAGRNAIILTVDSAADRTTYRAKRLLEDTSLGRNPRYTFMTWDFFKELQAITKLPIIPKGIQTVEDARRAIDAGAPAIFLSNHGGRALDGSPSPLEIAWEIHQEDPNIFEEVEVYADGGIRYGGDILKLLALGVRAVGLGRPFLYANLYGQEGVSRVISLLELELTSAAANVGLTKIRDVDLSYIRERK
ncbi:unnamed protein product [Alternaria sp. RS040]